MADSVKKTAFFLLNEVVSDYHWRKRCDGTIRGEIPDCRHSGYLGKVPLQTALCGRDNWPEEILDENEEPRHRDRVFLTQENLTYEDLKGFQIVGTGNFVPESSEELSLTKALEMALEEREEIPVQETEEFLPDFSQPEEPDTDVIQTTKPSNSRKVQREAKRDYWAKMKRRVNARKAGKPFPRLQKAKDWWIKPSQPRHSVVLFSKPESDEQIFNAFVAEFGESLNTPVELSLK